MPENKEKELLRRWMALWAEIDKTYIGFLKRWDLSLNAYWVIEYLHNHPQGAEPAELADRINVMRQLITPERSGETGLSAAARERTGSPAPDHPAFAGRGNLRPRGVRRDGTV